ncbi:hypothetical protein MPTK1_2g02560 [Marchantia polymorpha subsp. ruderalis]
MDILLGKHGICCSLGSTLLNSYVQFECRNACTNVPSFSHVVFSDSRLDALVSIQQSPSTCPLLEVMSSCLWTVVLPLLRVRNMQARQSHCRLRSMSALPLIKKRSPQLLCLL